MDTQPERDVVAEVTARLRTRFPEVDHQVIDQAVNETLAGYRDSRVHDFVPILVERDVAAQLRRRRAAPAAV